MSWYLACKICCKQFYHFWLPLYSICISSSGVVASLGEGIINPSLCWLELNTPKRLYFCQKTWRNFFPDCALNTEVKSEFDVQPRISLLHAKSWCHLFQDKCLQSMKIETLFSVFYCSWPFPLHRVALDLKWP